MAKKDNLVWMDLEMTGLDPEKDTILEASVIITNSRFEILAEFGPVIIHHTPQQLQKMNDWCKKHHKASGLTKEVLESSTTLIQAQAQLLNSIKKYSGPQMSPLCGNSIWQDRSFIRKYMPKIHEYLHYRVIDVSSVKEIVRRKYGEKSVLKKKETHRSLEDIRESIAELQHYTTMYLK